MSQELLPCCVRNVRLLDGCARCCLCLLQKGQRCWAILRGT